MEFKPIFALKDGLPMIGGAAGMLSDDKPNIPA